MAGHGIRNPRRSALICVAVTLLAWAFIAWGAFEMQQAGEETFGAALKIGVALLPAILAPAFFLNFWAGMKRFAAIRRGENAVARWTVTAAELAEFAAHDSVRNALGGENRNAWTPPAAPPASGLEIIFATDGVLVGDSYFPLVTTGLVTIGSVQLLAESAPAIAFRIVTTWRHEHRVRTAHGALRLPVSRLAGAEAARVVHHFERVDPGEILLQPDFYRRRMRFGLIAAPICFAVAAVGFLMEGTAMQGNARGADSVDIPLFLMLLGSLLGLMMLTFALAAWLMGRARRRKR